MQENQEKELILLENLGYLKPTEKSNYTKRYGIYKCHCGNEFKAQFQHINRKLTTSCGCIKKANIRLINKQNATHNLSKHRLYDTWKHMIQRCTNNKDKTYKNYGARGITVCKEWLDIKNFIDDMYPTYQEGLSIDRIDNDKGYYKDNCRWADSITQARNTRILRKDNKTGYRGVHKTTKRFYAKIIVNNIPITIGYYENKEDAALARNQYIIDNNLDHVLNILK